MNNKEIKVQLLSFIATHAETQTPTVRAQQEGKLHIKQTSWQSGSWRC